LIQKYYFNTRIKYHVSTAYYIKRPNSYFVSTKLKRALVNSKPSIEFTILIDEDEPAINFYRIKWIDKDTDSNAMISLYYGLDNTRQDGNLIKNNISEDDLLDEYIWDL